MPRKRLAVSAALIFNLLAASTSFATFAQQGGKLVPTGYVGPPQFGWSAAVSADGNTAIFGGYTDNSNVGAAWIFTRSGNSWTQQGAKLVGTGATGAALQGISVSISADGNTALVGGYSDNSGVGAAWVFTRTAGVWTQQGSKLVGSGAITPAHQGWSVALSPDGNTALVGGYSDAGSLGATWVFTRTAGVWTQQGSKLVGTGSSGSSVYQGEAVSVSADGNTALVGGYLDNFGAGAAWVFTRSAGVWTQQGPKLVGSGAVGSSEQGISVALSGDGNTAAVGAYGDNAQLGAVWIFTRSAGVWSQQGAKLTGAGEVTGGLVGGSVALSGDGNSLLAGGQLDNSGVGAMWSFRRSAGVWSQAGAKLVGTGGIGSPRQGYAVSLSADGNIAVEGGYGDNSSIGAAWAFANGSPSIVDINDVPNDQGGHVNLRWTSSFLDNVPGNLIDQYWIWRQVPASAALRAVADGATMVSGGTSAEPRAGRTFRATPMGAQVYYWEFVGSQVAHGFPAYSYTAPTTADSVPGSNPYTLFMVESEQLSSGLYWQSDPDSGYSRDNLPPLPPAPVAATYSAGATQLHWGANSEADFASYRVYRGASSAFVPGPGNLVVSQPDTGYADVGPAGNYYKLSAVDTHGNESGFALIPPPATTGVGNGDGLEFALAGARPNPARGNALRIAFSLPSGAPARLELFDTGGRRQASREVGTLGGGWHTVNLSEGRGIAPGLYWVQLTQGGNQRRARVAVIE